MTTVRESVFEMLRERGMTTIFGNPGSTELPMLADYPSDFNYVLGLQEAVAVGMADGYAQASGQPAQVNLHTAPGVGNGMGAIFNAQANKTPLLVTAGQQTRSLMTLQANLTNRDATRMPHPLVKWSYEPPRAEDVPHAIARGIQLASLPPKGPTFVSIPMDDWDKDVDDDAVAHQTGRRTDGRAGASPDAVAALAERLKNAERPVFVAGPDIDASGGWDAAVALVEAQNLPVWATPAPGGGRIGFPEGHPAYQGVLPPAVGPVGEVLAQYDLVIAAGTSIFPYYPNIAGPLLQGRHRARRDHERSGRGVARPDGRRDSGRREADAGGARRRGGQQRPRAAAAGRRSGRHRAHLAAGADIDHARGRRRLAAGRHRRRRVAVVDPRGA